MNKFSTVKSKLHDSKSILNNNNDITFIKKHSSEKVNVQFILDNNSSTALQRTGKTRQWGAIVNWENDNKQCKMQEQCYLILKLIFKHGLALTSLQTTPPKRVHNYHTFKKLIKINFSCTTPERCVNWEGLEMVILWCTWTMTCVLKPQSCTLEPRSVWEKCFPLFLLSERETPLWEARWPDG